MHKWPLNTENDQEPVSCIGATGKALDYSFRIETLNVTGKRTSQITWLSSLGEVVGLIH